MFKVFKKNKNNYYKINPSKNMENFSQDWSSEELSEGQLLVDVYETDESIIVKSTISGVKPENLSISLHRDILTIKGRREADALLKDAKCLLQECYLGSFSRSIILPEEVDNKKMQANLENGVLTIILEKVYKSSQIKIKIKS